jgi:alpha-beta hydrolase superfamily lysophospholipase
VIHGESTLNTFTASDGAKLALQDWPLAEGLAQRGTVVLVHGLGEHAGRYDPIARRLNAWGFVVRGYDHWGHGDSDGPRGSLTQNDRLIQDLADVVGSTRQHMPCGLPLIVLGHSMGGLVAASLVGRAVHGVDALVLSSPALETWLTVVQQFLLAVVPRIAPGLIVGNGLDARFLSHDADICEAYGRDPRVHDRISARLGRFLAEGGRDVIARAPRWKVPTLLMYAGSDRLVNPAGSQAFARAAPGDVVTARCFDALYHEIFNEPANDEVFETLRDWLDERF